MWIIGEVEARFWVRRVPVGVDLEWAYFPVRRYGADNEEERDQGDDKQQQSATPMTAAF